MTRRAVERHFRSGLPRGLFLVLVALLCVVRLASTASAQTPDAATTGLDLLGVGAQGIQGGNTAAAVPAPSTGWAPNPLTNAVEVDGIRLVVTSDRAAPSGGATQKTTARLEVPDNLKGQIGSVVYVLGRTTKNGNGSRDWDTTIQRRTATAPDYTMELDLAPGSPFEAWVTVDPGKSLVDQAISTLGRWDRLKILESSIPATEATTVITGVTVEVAHVPGDRQADPGLVKIYLAGDPTAISSIESIEIGAFGSPLWKGSGAKPGLLAEVHPATHRIPSLDGTDGFVQLGSEARFVLSCTHLYDRDKDVTVRVKVRGSDAQIDPIVVAKGMVIR